MAVVVTMAICVGVGCQQLFHTVHLEFCFDVAELVFANVICISSSASDFLKRKQPASLAVCPLPRSLKDLESFFEKASFPLLCFHPFLHDWMMKSVINWGY